MRAWIVLLFSTGIAGHALAQNDDLAALEVADKAPSATDERIGNLHVLAEAAFMQQTDRTDVSSQQGERLSLDTRYDHSFQRGVRFIFADRLDVYWQRESAGATEINTLKEAYISWQESPDRLLDLGRINVRDGAAMGYNPTDYFKFDAVRSVVSVNPASLRENRLGSVMLRAQQLWTGGSLTGLVSPRLASQPSDGPFSPDLGASNGQNRWLVALSQEIVRDFAPQLVLMGSEHQAPQAGLNLTHLLNSATVAFVEWSGGRGRTVATEAAGDDGSTSFMTRLATGMTYTAPNNLSVTLEYDRNDAAPDRAQWIALRQAGTQAFTRTVQFLSNSQDLPDRRALFLNATWTDFVLQHLDVSSFVRLDLNDHSRLNWAEARYHWTHLDVALQWQLNSGASGTIYGASSQRQLWQALVGWYLP